MGTGGVVADGAAVTATYTGWLTNGTQFDSNVGSTPIPFKVGVGQVIRGWDEGLVGQTVGSQVLLVVPPDQGYGAAGNSQIGVTGTDTLVFVVDILDAY